MSDALNKLMKYIVAGTYKPLLVRYLAKTRTYRHEGLCLTIPPEVFHPGFFFSTKLLLAYLDRLPMAGKTLLELGAGSGLISLSAARRGAMVTATDISPTAVRYLEKNRQINGLLMRILHSDLFESIPIMPFDLIAINPPYYLREPLREADWAWCCGESGQYFQRLFAGLGHYLHEYSLAILILCDGCDLDMIFGMAESSGFRLNCVQATRNWLEWNFIYLIQRAP